MLLATADVAANFRGVLKTATAERFVELELAAMPIVEVAGGERIQRGWRYHGWYYDTVIHMYGEPMRFELRFIYSIYGASKDFLVPNGDAGTIVLEEKGAGDTVSGKLIARIDENGDLTGIWQSIDASISYPFTLKSDTNESIVRVTDIYVDVDFLRFWEEFRAAIRERQYERLASMIRFPYNFASCIYNERYDSPNEAITRSQFIRDGDQILDTASYHALTSLAPLEIDPEIVPDSWDFAGLKPGMVYYPISFNPMSEYALSYFFANVDGEYKLVHFTCAG